MPRLRKSKRHQVLGITGSFGSGKTTVAKLFGKFGAKVIDADRIGHNCLKDVRVKKRLKAIFGPEVFSGDNIDRKKLAAVVFKEKHLLGRLCRILHPLIIKRINFILSRLPEDIPLVAIDAPLLIEAGLNKAMDATVVVTVPRRVQLRRLINKGYTHSQILSRLGRQLSLSRKLKLADYVIDNGDSLGKTRQQVKKIWGELNYGRN